MWRLGETENQFCVMLLLFFLMSELSCWSDKLMFENWDFCGLSWLNLTENSICDAYCWRACQSNTFSALKSAGEEFYADC